MGTKGTGDGDKCEWGLIGMGKLRELKLGADEMGIGDGPVKMGTQFSRYAIVCPKIIMC
jgi:hypothetical protein